MAELTPQQLQKFQKDLEKLNTLKRQLREEPIKIEASVDSLNLLNDSLERAEDLISNINDGSKGLATSFRNIVSEIKYFDSYRDGVITIAGATGASCRADPVANCLFSPVQGNDIINREGR